MTRIFKDSRPMIDSTAAGFGAAAVGGAILIQSAPILVGGAARFGQRVVSATYNEMKSNESAAYALAFGMSFLYVAAILAMKLFGVDVGNHTLYAVGVTIFGQSMLSIYVRFDGLSEKFPSASHGYQAAWCWTTLASWAFIAWCAYNASSTLVGNAVVFSLAISAVLARMAYRLISIRRKSQICAIMARDIVAQSNGNMDMAEARKSMRWAMRKQLASARLFALKIEISTLIAGALIIGYLTDYIRL